MALEVTNFIEKDGLSYCGKEAQEIFVKNLYKSDLKGYGIKYMPNVKGKTKLASGEVGDMFQAYTCPFTPQGTVKLSESYIEPEKIKVNLEECFDEFVDNFLVEQTEATLNGGIPQMFYDWFFNNVLMQELNKEYEEIFWNGDKQGSGYLALADGIVKKATNDPNSVKVNKVTLTVANVLSKIGEVAEKIDELDNDTEGYKIFVNYKTYRKVKTALGNSSPQTNDVWANFEKGEGNKIFAYGFELVPTRIEKDTIIASHPLNLVLGYDVADSEVAYKIVDMRETTLDDVFRVGVISNIATGIVYNETLVITV